MGNKLLDYEDNMRGLVPRHVLIKRQDYCANCEHRGANNFCQKNAQWLTEFVKMNYNACPAGIWTDS